MLHGCFLARVIVTWIHFLLNEPKECESIDKDVRVPFSSIKFSLYIYNYNETGIARFLESISSVTVTIYNLISMPLMDSTTYFVLSW